MMDWTQVITVFAVIATNLGTVIALYIQMDNKMEMSRKETSDILRSIQKESSDILRGIQAEIKDFHGRLCAIEERNKK